MIGRTLAGRYRLTRPIGEGGMGVVYEADQLDLKRRVAIKVLHTADARSLERFMQEALATANLASPNVVTVLEFNPGSADDPPFLVMELLSGETLAMLLLREQKLSVSRAVGIAVQMLVGLGAAHAAGIVHRDIKPSNVFLVPAVVGGDFVKLLDFGIAKLVDGEGMLTTTGALLGTPAYVAPEQLRHERADARTDVHAVGVCLYEMLAGRRPWRTSGPQLTAEILRDAPIPLGSSSPEMASGLVHVVERALAKDRAHRFASANEMLEALKPWLGPIDETRRAAPRPVPAPNASTAPPPALATQTVPIGMGSPDPQRTAQRHESEQRKILTVIAIAMTIFIVLAVGARFVPKLLARRSAARTAPAAAEPLPEPEASTVATEAPVVLATPSAFPTATTSPLPEVDGCFCVYEEVDARVTDAGGPPICRTVLCREHDVERCTCNWATGFGVPCKVPMKGGRCPHGKEWTPKDVVAKESRCVGYLHNSVGPEAPDEIAPTCSVCYTLQPQRGTPNELCYANDPNGEVRAGRWKCGRNALLPKPVLTTCAERGQRGGTY